LKDIVTQLIQKDKDGLEIFSQAVPLEVVTDYLDHVQTPMDLGAMLKNVNANNYGR
jgi:hypothetical protein